MSYVYIGYGSVHRSKNLMKYRDKGFSSLQIEEFRRLKNHMKGEQVGAGDEAGCLVDNFRPTQPLNKRTVWASFR